MGAPPKKLYQQLAALPEGKVGEIVGGLLIVSPRPSPRHALAQMALASELGPPFMFGRGGPGGWWILPEPELHLGEEVLVPDLAGWRRDRLPELPAAASFSVVPDWVCEITSPSNERLDRQRKLPRYLELGVRHAWVVDPSARTLEAMRSDAGAWREVATLAGDLVARVEPFGELELSLGALWLP